MIGLFFYSSSDYLCRLKDIQTASRPFSADPNSGKGGKQENNIQSSTEQVPDGGMLSI